MKIRRSVFETNSSSVHVIGISREMPEKDMIPKEYKFMLGEFGWEVENYTNAEDRGAYLYTLAAYRLYDSENEKEFFDWCAQVAALLHSYGVEEVEFAGIKYLDMVQPENSEVEKEILDSYYYYVDHGYNWGDEFVESFAEDGEKLIKFLFGEHSEISTGNDNTDGCMPSGVSDEFCDVYERGN